MLELKPSLATEQAKYQDHALLVAEKYTFALRTGIIPTFWVKNDKGQSDAVLVNQRMIFAARLVATGVLNEG